MRRSEGRKAMDMRKILEEKRQAVQYSGGQYNMCTRVGYITGQEKRTQDDLGVAGQDYRTSRGHKDKDTEDESTEKEEEPQLGQEDWKKRNESKRTVRKERKRTERKDGY
jgi:hypothetical protein